MNNKGFAISSIMYSILVVFLILLLGILGMLGSRKVILDKVKKDLKESLETSGDEKIWDFMYTGNYQEFIVPSDGKYKIQLWGASGGSNDVSTGGFGAYTEGLIDLSKNTILYLYVGESGKMQSQKGEAALTQTFNGGGASSSNSSAILGSGGGATDVRLVNSTWNNFESLKTRIMVAAGGGTGVDFTVDNSYDTDAYTNGSNAGGLSGNNGIILNGCEHLNDSSNCTFVTHPEPLGGSQMSGGNNTYSDTSTYGKFGSSGSTINSSGGGSGYFGGQGGIDSGFSPSGGGSGSSFISGHDGCVAIDENSTSSSISFKQDSNHYLGYVFTETKMVDGEGYNWTNEKGNYEGQIQPDGTTTIGHNGNGHARITKIN
ncbi:MAG: hypothetical protein IJ134_03480 [Bacilli bacterium]|nr:hypothetical protein [Bacilli bacterium]